MAAVPLITAHEAPAARAAAQKVVRAHERLSAWLRPGVTLAQIDAFVARTLDEMACRSCFLNYQVPRSPKFPSHACLSLNDCVVHGTAGYYLPPMRDGDVLKIDIGVWFEGWVGDAAWTYVFGQPTPQIRRLTECGKQALALGVKELRPGQPYLNWARAVQACVESAPPKGYGFHLIRGLGGHGYGRKLHGPPFVSNVVPVSPGEWPDALTLAQPGTLVAVEPMIAVGTGDTTQKPGTWPVFTADHSLSVHYEQGPEILTEGLENLRDVIA